MSADPTSWTWATEATAELPSERLFDAAKVLYDESDFTGDAGDFANVAYSLPAVGEGPAEAQAGAAAAGACGGCVPPGGRAGVRPDAVLLTD